MSNPPPQQQRQPAAARGQRRQVTLPGAQQKERRSGLVLIGLVIVFGSAFGFWFVLRSIDQRSEYLMAARTIERWQVVRSEDFTAVEANVGLASALGVDQLGSVSGKWATGRIPAGTIITAGLFESPPLSAESESDKVLIQVRVPTADAPFGSLNSGDTVALLGRESSGPDGGASALSLIGVLRLEFVQGDNVYYVVTPEEALQIKGSVDRYARSSDRTMLKLGFGLSAEDLERALESHAASDPAAGDPAAGDPAAGDLAADALFDAIPGFEPVEGP